MDSGGRFLSNLWNPVHPEGNSNPKYMLCGKPREKPHQSSCVRSVSPVERSPLHTFSPWDCAVAILCVQLPERETLHAPACCDLGTLRAPAGCETRNSRGLEGWEARLSPSSRMNASNKVSHARISGQITHESLSINPYHGLL